MYELFPSPHSGILFLSYPRWDLSQIYKDSFRPLIRGFFFYVGNVPSLVMAHQRVSVPSFGDSFFMVKKNESNDRRKRRFPSPHSGILFLSYPRWDLSQIYKDSFRPLIRGFFFYNSRLKRKEDGVKRVSVPSFGDSFFIPKINKEDVGGTVSFPSPHSGILFLYLQPGTLVIVRVEEAFPSPHSGILFLC